MCWLVNVSDKRCFINYTFDNDIELLFLGMKNIDTHDGIEMALKLAVAGKPFSVSAAMEVIIIRLKFIYDEIYLHKHIYKNVEPAKIRSTIVRRLVEFANPTISLNQAYIDYTNAVKYFSIGMPIEAREMNLNLAIENCMEGYQLAIEKEDFKAAAAFQKNHIELIKMMPSLEEINYKRASEDLNNLVTIFVFDPDLIQSHLPLKERISANIEDFETLKRKYEKDIVKRDKMIGVEVEFEEM